MIVVDGGPVWLYLLGRLIEIGVVILFTVLWLVSEQRALQACEYSNRKMQPGQVWLTFIPLFGLVWQFIAVTKVSESLAQEYHTRGWKSDEGRPGIESGMIACSIIVIILLVRILIPDLNPALAFFSSLGICICMFMHRDRLNAFTERLEAENLKAQQSYVFGNQPNPFLQPQYGAYYTPPVQQYSYQQYQQPVMQQTYQQPVQPVQQPQVAQSAPPQEEYHSPGWDGTTTWEAPANWSHPDLSDPSPYFS